MKVSGRARKVTFHIFEPEEIEDVLDHDLPTLWREQDMQQPPRTHDELVTRLPVPGRAGWGAFADDGLLR